MLNFKSKLLGALFGAIFTLAATGAYAELHKGEFSFGYFDQTHELNALGMSFEGDEDGWRYSASIFLRDNLSFSLALSEAEFKGRKTLLKIQLRLLVPPIIFSAPTC